MLLGYHDEEREFHKGVSHCVLSSVACSSLSPPGHLDEARLLTPCQGPVIGSLPP